MAEHREHERRWPASVAVLAVLALQVVLPHQIAAGTWWLTPALELMLLLPLVVTNPVRLDRETAVLRSLALLLVLALAVVNAVHLARLVAAVTSGESTDPRVLVQAALLIWTTNVVTGALGLWEMDRSGPFARDPRHGRPADRPDLLFPQMTGVPGWDPQTWRPSFLDYLFVSFTAATAFSPTDTAPLSGRAKVLVAAIGSVSLVTIGVIAARAINAL
ncbi:hypothetical protein DDE18_06830 [Nocardioides gansuensis]|uniref:DUF1345 domain-containing protein n=1 Tax=Nocardioides gansuensis TaxID=2138300 RepID=A0A2T8FE54_9ACTN|nr:hypothetical protein [Nocardioides gansuensis]PVG83987.1 hypothetical protein DDE18_06830 [Nocardioides gansuensis]